MYGTGNRAIGIQNNVNGRNNDVFGLRNRVAG